MSERILKIEESQKEKSVNRFYSPFSDFTLMPPTGALIVSHNFLLDTGEDRE